MLLINCPTANYMQKFTQKFILYHSEEKIKDCLFNAFRENNRCILWEFHGIYEYSQ